MSSAVLVAAFTGTQAYAAAPTLSDVLGASGITFNGAIDTSYDWSANDSVVGRAFDVENDGFSLHQVNLTAAKDFGGGIGAMVNGIYGDDAKIINGGATPGSAPSDFDLTQAFLSYTAGNLTVIGGRYVTLASMEVINPSGNLNASRSFLFGLVPFAHTGVRATYKVNDMIAVTAGMNNGVKQSKVDNNTSQTAELQLALTPLKNLSVFLTGYSGNEDNTGSHGQGVLRSDTVDLVVNFNLTDAIYFGLNADYLNMEGPAPGRHHNEVNGVAGYAQFKFLPKWRVAVRSEYVAFNEGGGSGVFAVRENTLTLAHACTDNLEILAEGRADRAVGDRFASSTFDVINHPGGDNDQYTATLKAILKF